MSVRPRPLAHRSSFWLSQLHRTLVAEALEDRRLLSASGSSSPDDILAALAGMAAEFATAPSSSFSSSDDEVSQLLNQAQQGAIASSMVAVPQSEASFTLTALDQYVAAPDPNFGFSVARTFAGVGFDGHVLKLQSQEWRTPDEVNRTLWEHWLIIAIPHQLNPQSNSALLAITGGNNRSVTPPSNFSIAELGTIAGLTGTVVAELRMVPNQPLTFASETQPAGTFAVPGESPDLVELDFHFDSGLGGLQFSFGFYDLASVTADPVTQKRDYAVQAITSGALLFDERIDSPGSLVEYNVVAGSELGFFIVPDDTVANFLADPNAYYGGGKRAPLFSLPSANPGQLDQMTVSIEPGVTRIQFEDLSRVGGGSDNNFTDVQIAIHGELSPVPLPPGLDIFGTSRTEDAIIAYTFDQYLATGDDTWPALLPMVKSAVRAMDAVQQFVPQAAAGHQIEDFVVSGGSKRGWTTWLTAAADAASADPRVKAIVPMVFDALNLDEHLAHHKEYYEGVTDSILAGYSNALKDYTALDVIEAVNTPEGQQLLSIVDPYEYLDRLTMPKFMINSTGDEFFVPDSGQFYLGDLPGQNYVRYVPNTNHDVLDDSDAGESLIAYYDAIVNDLPLPRFTWSVEDGGTTIRVNSIDTPLEVNVWQATNYTSTDYRRSVTGIPWSSSPLTAQSDGSYVAQIPEPNVGSTAFMVEMVYPGGIFPFKFTTRVSVLQAAEENPTESSLVPELVADINDRTLDASIANLTPVNGTLFFTAFDRTHGTELWKTNGTAGGTVLVADIAPGPSSSYPYNLTKVGGTLFFTAYSSAHGSELWKSDGTAEGTVLVANIRPDNGYPSGSYPSSLTAMGGSLFFTAYDNAHGRELWKSDGTGEGTVLVANIRSDGPYYSRGSDPLNLTALGGTLFFSAHHDDYGRELWKSDGTAEGTQLVADLRPSDSYGYPHSSTPENLTAVGGRLFFTAYDDEHGRELWKSDGTAAGTLLVADIRPTSPYSYPQSSYPLSLTAVGRMLYFTADDNEHGRELWKSDGTTAGTKLVADIFPTSTYGYAHSSAPAELVAVGGTLFFTANDDVHGRELWKSNGTAAGTVLVSNIATDSPYGTRSSDPTELMSVGGAVYFVAYSDEHGRELWKSDGTTAGTMNVANIRQDSPYLNGSYPANLTVMGGKLFFTASDEQHGLELWKSGGTAISTSLVKDITVDTPGSYPQQFTEINGVLYFTASDDRGHELWTSDGTVAGVRLVADIFPGATSSYPENLTNVGGILYFTARDETHGNELWKSDGTAAGTVRVADIWPSGPYGNSGSYPLNLANIGGLLYFSADDGSHGRELWKSDGTEAGTVLVADIRDNSLGGWQQSSYPANLTAVDGTLFFTAHDNVHGRELWKSDGTAEGTVLVADIRPTSHYGYPRSSDPMYLIAVGGTLYFTAYEETHGRELWKSDGTTEGTVLLADIYDEFPGGSSYPSALTNVGGVLFFGAYGNGTGRELWKSDGTVEGTKLIRDIELGYGSSDPISLTNVDGQVFFTAFHQTLGIELWTSDGTAQGTIPVKNIRPGSSGSYPAQLTSVGGKLFFVAHDSYLGGQLWQSDGTAQGTVMLPAPVGTDSGGFYPNQLTNVGGTLFFSATGQNMGQEPWALVQPIEIDIRPGSVINLVNLASSGEVPVAVLGSATFDASAIDASTLTLAGAHVATKLDGTPKSTLVDINGDGVDDLLVRFSAQGLNLAFGDTTAMLEGKLLDGQRIRGSDQVRVLKPLGSSPASAAIGDQQPASSESVLQVTASPASAIIGSAVPEAAGKGRPNSPALLEKTRATVSATTDKIDAPPAVQIVAKTSHLLSRLPEGVLANLLMEVDVGEELLSHVEDTLRVPEHSAELPLALSRVLRQR